MNFSGCHLRQFVFIGVSFLLVCSRLHAKDGDGDQVRIQVDTKNVVGQISSDFIGFGYESSAVAQPNYFSPSNTSLIRLYRNLSTHGLIRIGGNVSDHTQYAPDGISTVNSERGVTIINRANLADLAAFARLTGWRVMWGLNLGTGSKEQAVQEAEAVAVNLGDRLQSFEIGNEVDIHGHYGLKFYNFGSYYSNYLSFKAAVQEVLPEAVFSGPDVAGSVAWLQDFAKSEGQGVRLLTHHYYRTGEMTPGATIENLLASDTGWQAELGRLQQISQDSGVPFRINEINSFYGGGKAGVSDTFASALWCLDNMFVLAFRGCNGVNMETDINHLAWISHYSPIVHDATMKCWARPEYYGMLAFALAGEGELLPVTVSKGDINLTAYATHDKHGSFWVVVVNKDLARDALLEVTLPDGYGGADAFRLEAPLVTSTNQVILAGAEVSADGQWNPGSPQRVPALNGVVQAVLPREAAILLRLRSLKR